MYRPFSLLLFCLLFLALPAFPQTSPTMDLSSPEAAVRSFVQSVNQLDPNGANCLVGGKVDRDLRQWTDSARKSSEKLALTVVGIESNVTGDIATAAVSVEASANGQKLT